MDHDLPPALRAGAGSREPILEPGSLAADSLEERLHARARALEAIRIPDAPVGKPPPRRTTFLPPSPDASGGTQKIVRNSWVAKYSPYLGTERPEPLVYSDVFVEYPWDDGSEALADPWIHSGLMRGGPRRIPEMDIGDLVFPMRCQWLPGDPPWLTRRCLVGVWRVESIAYWPDGSSEVVTLPIRRFDFPVPIVATSDQDRAFDDVAAFHDRSRLALVDLSADEAVAVTRVCGLPASMLTEPDPDLLPVIAEHLDLGPPTVVRRRILDGARAVAHRQSVEKAARDVAVRALLGAKWGVVSTELQRGLGSDLWGKAREGSRLVKVRVEVKGLSGANPLSAQLTQSERDAAIADRGSGGWYLVVVTRALRSDRKEHWYRSDEVVRRFATKTGSRFTGA